MLRDSLYTINGVSAVALSTVRVMRRPDLVDKANKQQLTPFLCTGVSKRSIMIKSLTSLLMGFILCASLSAQTEQKEHADVTPDSVFVFTYRPQVRMFETKTGSNRQMLKGLAASLQNFRKGTDTLYIDGYAGAYGNERADRGTAFWRCINLAQTHRSVTMPAQLLHGATPTPVRLPKPIASEMWGQPQTQLIATGNNNPQNHTTTIFIPYLINKTIPRI